MQATPTAQAEPAKPAYTALDLGFNIPNQSVQPKIYMPREFVDNPRRFLSGIPAKLYTPAFCLLNRAFYFCNVSYPLVARENFSYREIDDLARANFSKVKTQAAFGWLLTQGFIKGAPGKPGRYTLAEEYRALHRQDPGATEVTEIPKEQYDLMLLEMREHAQAEG